MELKKIKLHKVLTCDKEDSVKNIANRLKENKERRIFVKDKKGKLIGIITTTDLVYKALDSDQKDLTADDIMTPNVESVDAKESLDRALEIMNKLKTFVCPVTDEGKVIGLVSYHDLVGYVLESMQ